MVYFRVQVAKLLSIAEHILSAYIESVWFGSAALITTHPVICGVLEGLSVVREIGQYDIVFMPKRTHIAAQYDYRSFYKHNDLFVLLVQFKGTPIMMGLSENC